VVGGAARGEKKKKLAFSDQAGQKSKKKASLGPKRKKTCETWPRTKMIAAPRGRITKKPLDLDGTRRKRGGEEGPPPSKSPKSHRVHKKKGKRKSPWAMATLPA